MSLAALFVIGCSVHPEQPLLERFFAASRLRDRTALQALSTIIFEPREDGIVTNFKIAGVTEEQASGDTVTKNATITAPVKLSDGQIVQKTLVVTLERRADVWIVTGVAAFQR